MAKFLYIYSQVFIMYRQVFNMYYGQVDLDVTSIKKFGKQIRLLKPASHREVLLIHNK